MTEPAHFPADLNLEEFGFEATPWDEGPATGPDDLALYVVGDIHGRSDLLGAMHGAIALSIQEGAPTGEQLSAGFCYVGADVYPRPDCPGGSYPRAAPPPAPCSHIS